MKKYLWFGLLLVVLVACRDGGSEEITAVTKEDFDFKVEQIYDKAIVQKAAEQSTAQELTASKNDLAKAKELAAAENLDECSEKLKNAILKYPTPEAYFELGKVNMKQGNFEKAAEALTLAADLGFEDKAEALYMKSAALSKVDTKAAMEVLKEAISLGFKDKQRIIYGEELIALRGTEEFLDIANDVNGGELASILFDLYINSFPKGTLPFQLKANELNEVSDEIKKTITYAFAVYVPEIKDLMYSDEIEEEYRYVARFETDNGFHLAVYGGNPVDAEMGPLYYFVAAYTKDGELTDKILLASREDLEEVYFGEIAENYEITVSQNKVVLEKNGTKIIESKVVTQSTYTINEEGKFIEN